MKVPILYTIDEVAQKTRASRGTVEHWLRKKLLVGIKVGRRRLIAHEELLHFLGLRSEPPTNSTQKEPL